MLIRCHMSPEILASTDSSVAESGSGRIFGLVQAE